jgi:hypothetical protein
LREENTKFSQSEEERRKKYEADVENLNAIRIKIENDRQKEIDEQHQAEIDRLARQKETWAKHQDQVQEVIKGICQKHTITYVENVPFKELSVYRNYAGSEGWQWRTQHPQSRNADVFG